MARITRQDWKDGKVAPAIGDIVVESCGCEQEIIDIKGNIVVHVTNDRTAVCADCQARRVIEQANAVKARRRQEVAQRLLAIDAEAGPRATREELIALGRKGFNNKIETLENEAKALRTELAGL